MTAPTLAERVATTHPKLVAWFIRRGIPPAEAEDLAQESWLVLARAAERGQVVTWPYLWATARCRLLSWMRYRRAHGGVRQRQVSLELLVAAGREPTMEMEPA